MHKLRSFYSLQIANLICSQARYAIQYRVLYQYIIHIEIAPNLFFLFLIMVSSKTGWYMLVWYSMHLASDGTGQYGIVSLISD